MIPLDTWLRSDSPKKLCYDAVMLLSTGVIRFIQTTIAREHDLNMVSLSGLVGRLRKAGHKVEDAEIFFVIPDDPRAKDFQISYLQEWEGFVQLFDSWPKNIDAVREKLQTVMIPF